MKTNELTIEEYLEILSSKEPVPGGGNASAIAGAMGASLTSMVINLTIGKKKYLDVEEEMKEALKHAVDVQKVFLKLADKDAEVFLPLSRAYSMPKNTEEEKRVRESYLEQVLYDASLVPLNIMECVEGFLPVLKKVAKKGSKIAISDAFVAATYLQTAVEGASVNVKINANLMKNPEKKQWLLDKVDKILQGSLGEIEVIKRISSSRL